MRSVLLDRLYQKRYSFLIYLLFSVLMITLLLPSGGPVKAILIYFYLCFFWNHLVKPMGRPRNWDLVWSLPLKESDILIGTSLSFLMTGWVMNFLLFLSIRLYLPLPWMLLLIMCLLQLFTDLLQQIMGYGSKESKAQSYAAFALWVGFSFVLILLGKEKVLNFFTWLMGLSPYYLVSLAVLFYLAISYLLLLNIRRIRKKMKREN